MARGSDRGFHLGGVSAGAGVYATPTDFVDGEPNEELQARLNVAAEEALWLATDA